MANNNQYSVLLGVQLDTSSIKKFQNDIKNLKLDSLKISIDSSEIKSVLSELTTKLQEVQAKTVAPTVDTSSASGGINKLITSYTTLSELINGVDTTNAVAKQIEGTSNLESTVRKLSKTYESLAKAQATGSTNPQMGVWQRQIEDMTASLLKSEGFFDAENFKNFSNIFAESARNIEAYKLKVNENIGSSLNIGNLETQLNTIENQFNNTSSQYKNLISEESQLSSVSEKITSNINEMKNLMQSMDESDNIESVIEDYQEFNNLLTETKNQYATLKTETLNINGSMKFDAQIEQFLNQLNVFKGQYGSLTPTDATDSIGSQINNIITKVQELKGTTDTFSLAKLKNEFKTLNNEVNSFTKNTKFQIEVNEFKQALSEFEIQYKAVLPSYKQDLEQIKATLDDIDETGLTGLKSQFSELTVRASQQSASLFSKVKKQLGELGIYYSASFVLMQTKQLFLEMYSNIVDIDTAMTNLYKVTDETDEKYDEFLSNASEKAIELGSTITDIVEESANWAKLGYNIDEASDLAEISTIYANVGEVDSETAVSDLVTAMKAFNIEAEDAITIVDALNELGNNYATSAADLGTGLSKSASAMNAAGADLDETLAMLTGVIEITQDADSAGNFLKTASMRIRGMKGELEELGEEVDDSVDSISKVQTQILNLTGGEVNIFDESGSFRDYYDIMKDIADVYDDLSSTSQASLTEILFGKTRANQGLALIQAFQSGSVTSAYEDAINSSGSAMAEQEKWEESLEAKTNQLKAAFEDLSNTFLSSNFFGNLLEIGTSLLKVLTDIINNVGTLPLLLSSLSGIITYKSNRNIFSIIHDSIKGAISGIKEFISSVNAATSSTQTMHSKIEITGGTATASMKSATIATEGLNTAEKSAAVSANLLKSAINSFAMLGIVVAIQYIASAWYEVKQAQQEAYESAVENINASIEEMQTINNLYTTYQEAVQAYKDGTGAKEDYVNAGTKLLEQLSVEQSEINNLSDSYDKLNNKVLEATSSELKSEASDATENFETIMDEVKDAASDVWTKSIGQESRMIQFGLTYTMNDDDVDNVDIAQALVDNGIIDNDSIYYDSHGGVVLRLDFVTDIDDDESYIEGYEKLLAYKEALIDLYEDEDALFSMSEVQSSDVYKTITKAIEKMDGDNDAISTYLEMVESVNSNLAEAYYLDYVIANGNIETYEQYLELENQLLLQAEGDTAGYVGTLSERKDAVMDYLSSISEISEYTADDYISFEDKLDKLKSAYSKSLDDVNEIAKVKTTEFNEWIDSLNDDETEYIYSLYFDDENAITNIDELKEKLEQFREDTEFEELQTQFQSFAVLLDDNSSTIASAINEVWESLYTDSDSVTSLSDTLSNIESKISDWQELYESVADGELSTDDLTAILKSDYSGELIPYIDDLSKLSEVIQNCANKDISYFIEQLQALKSQLTDETQIALVDEMIEWVQVSADLENSLEDLEDAFDTINEKISDFKSELDSLQDAYDGIDDGSLSASDLIDLIQEFPELVQYTHNTEELQNALQSVADTKLEDTISELEKYKEQLTDIDEINAVDFQIAALKALSDLSLSGEDEVTAELEKQQEEIQDKIDAIEDVIDKLEDEKAVQEDILENLEKQQEELEDIISDYETASDTVISTLEDEIEKLEEEQENAKSIWDERIEALEAEHDAQEETNDLLEKEKALKEALKALDEAKNTKVRVYSASRGYTIQTDSSAVAEAQEAYDEALQDYNDTVAEQEYDAQIEELEKQRDAESTIYDERIQEYEDYKQAWEDAVNIYQNMQDELTTATLLGSNWREQILNKDSGVIDNFVTNYEAYQNRLHNVIEPQIEDVQNVIDAYEDEINAQEVLKEEQEDYLTELENYVTEYEESGEKLNNILSGISQQIDYQTNSLNNQSIAAENASVSLDKYANSVENVSDKISNYKQQLQDSAIYEGDTSSNYTDSFLSATTAGSNKITSLVGSYADGGVVSETGLAMVHGSSSQPEVVFNNSEAQKLWEWVNSLGSNNTQLYTEFVNSISGVFSDITSTLSALGVGSDSSLAQNTSINNIGSTNSNNKTYSWTITGNNINADSYSEFKECMDRYIRESQLDLMVNK